jgi:3-hydroxyacyl-[acyl-carrier-protein] dehydratase
MLDIGKILEILPHRYPFLLVDRMDEVEIGKRAVGVKNVTFNEPFFQGHWPGDPVMPGVLIVEHMLQVGGVLLLSQVANEGKQAFIAGADKVRFKRRVVPGDQLVTEVEVLRCKGDIGKIAACCRVSGEVACKGEFMFALVDADPETLEADGSEEGE